MRKLTLVWSAIGSPRPLPNTGGGRVNDQLVRVPVVLPWLVIWSVQVPVELIPLSWLSGICGLNGPMSNGGAAVCMGCVAKSSKVVLVKLDRGGLLPTFVNNLIGITVLSGAIRT